MKKNNIEKGENRDVNNKQSCVLCTIIIIYHTLYAYSYWYFQPYASLNQVLLKTVRLPVDFT